MGHWNRFQIFFGFGGTAEDDNEEDEEEDDEDDEDDEGQGTRILDLAIS